MVKLGVVIVTYNRLALLKECVNACQKQTKKFTKIYIVNNASTDGTAEYLHSIKKSHIEIIDLPENRGGAGGFAAGMKRASSNSDLDYILLIDDDAIIAENFNEEIVKGIEKYGEDVLGYSGTVYTDRIVQCQHRSRLKTKQDFIVEGCPIEEYKGEAFVYDLATFCGVYISRKVMQKAGLPREDFFIWLDDAEYCFRLLKKTSMRGHFININAAKINHKSKSSSSGMSWKNYYGERNRLVIVKQYYPLAVVLKNYLRLDLRIIRRLLFGKNKFERKVAKMFAAAKRDAKHGRMGKSAIYNPEYKLEG